MENETDHNFSPKIVKSTSNSSQPSDASPNHSPNSTFYLTNNSELEPPHKKQKAANELSPILTSGTHLKVVDLTNCDREPIQFLGSIQNHGFLIVLDSNRIIQTVSSNVADYLQFLPEEMIGKDANEFFEDLNLDLEDMMRNNVGSLRESEGNVIKKGGERRWVHLNSHVNRDGLVMVECEEKPEVDFEYGLHISRIFNSFTENGDLYSVLDAIAKEIKDTTEYNRVMIYEFDEEYNGRVIVERSDDEPRFLNLHFPKTDIPAQARELFRKNRFRVIEDVDKPLSEIFPTVSNLDLTMCTLRGVSKMHLQYLKNMQVRASMTISILVGHEKRLWGLITCHHSDGPKNLGYSQRRFCDLLGTLLSSQVEAILQRREVVKRLNMETEISVAKEPLVMLDMKMSPWETLQKLFPIWMKLIHCDGVLLNTEGRNYSYGLTGNSSLEIVQWVEENVKDADSFVCDSIVDLGLKCEGTCCGFIYVRLKDATYAGLYFFRNEYIRSITWGGEPKKADEFGNLNPRTSFNQFKELMRGKCLHWDSVSLEYAIHIQSIMTRYLIRWKSEMHRIEAENERESVDRLMKENEMSRQAAILHNQFLATVSHELRTPIHSIMGNTERLADVSAMNADSKSACNMIQSSSEHLLCIISDILDLSKLESSSLEIHPVPFDFYINMENVIHTLYTVARSKGLFVNLLLPVQVPILIGDSNRIGQILLNFISNAVKYTREGGITIRADVVEKGRSDMKILYRIIDTGKGIPADKIPNLFQKYTQIDTSKSRKFSGTGLGLSINKQLADVMGGEVNVESEEGKGSTFSLKLKFKIVVGQNVNLPYIQVPRERGESTVVVCDNRAFVREFISHHCRQWNLETSYINNLSKLTAAIDNRVLALFLSFSEGEKREAQEIATKLSEKYPRLIIVVVQNREMKENSYPLGEDVEMITLPLTLQRLHRLLCRTNIPSPVLKAKKEKTELKDMKKLHILLADDNKINQMIAQTFLSTMGHTCEIVDNGALAVKAFQASKFDVVLMDIMMPVLDGINATLQIRQFEKYEGREPTPIIALTAAGEASLKDQCLERGMNLCLFKPFHKADLHSTLKKVTGSR
eukprot:TRINITY_DN7371_c0_g1_i1.p1 TRINITY_DN7371_c0_g1~~TRINITY_DN7371_c0_g1_i1.p1  ORF type:complete len:1094 (+),score=301.88 TRINITY_DN7371_c0_g1_i1:102-3383(+)